MPVYADLGVMEVWRYNGTLKIYQLQNKQYVQTRDSQAFPGVAIAEIDRFLQQAMNTDYLALVGSFRQWIKSQVRG